MNSIGHLGMSPTQCHQPTALVNGIAKSWVLSPPYSSSQVGCRFQSQMIKFYFQVLFKSFYTNRTRTIQDHTFRTERRLNSTCGVQLERGVTRECGLSLSLGLPDDVANATASFGRSVSVNAGQRRVYITMFIKALSNVPTKVLNVVLSSNTTRDSSVFLTVSSCSSLQPRAVFFLLMLLTFFPAVFLVILFTTAFLQPRARLLRMKSRGLWTH